MGDSLTVKPELRATAAVRRAASGCCAAKLNPGTGPGSFTCRACGKPCARVLSEPEEVPLNG